MKTITKINQQKGQIAIITLFSLAVFVVVGGSVVTQIIFEQKKAVLEQKSRQAYFAAESGIESALQSILTQEDVYGGSSLEVGEANVEVTASTYDSGQTFIPPSAQSSGQGYFLNLRSYPGNRLRVCWDKADTGVVASYFYTNASARLRSNSYAFNSAGSTNITNGLQSSSASGACGMTGTVYYYDFTLPAGTPSYFLAWTTYQDMVQFGFAGLDGHYLPAQGTIITSTAQVAENEQLVTREIKYFVSRVSGTDLLYPPVWLTTPIYSVGGVTY